MKDTWKYSFKAWNSRFLPNRYSALHMPKTKKNLVLRLPDKIGGSVKLEFQTNNDCVFVWTWSKYCMRHTYLKNLFVEPLKFQCNWVACILFVKSGYLSTVYNYHSLFASFWQFKSSSICQGLNFQKRLAAIKMNSLQILSTVSAYSSTVIIFFPQPVWPSARLQRSPPHGESGVRHCWVGLMLPIYASALI